MTIITATRYHDFSAGHRVVGHENKCALLHGHNYRVHFTCESPSLDEVGRVIDFSDINLRLCSWLENNWDHKFIAWREDPLLVLLNNAVELHSSLVWVPFNPTAENMAAYLLHKVGPEQLKGTDITLTRVQVDETRKCGAAAELRR